MANAAQAALEKRLRQLAFRVAQRRSAYAQRHHAAGVWFEVRRVLALAATAAVIDEAEADELEAEGFVPDPHGRRLSPPKRIFTLPPARTAILKSRKPCAVRLEASFLEARSWALERF